jgi:hypothetical protein
MSSTETSFFEHYIANMIRNFENYGYITPLGSFKTVFFADQVKLYKCIISNKFTTF